jgi:hypothetical protein
LEENVAGPVKKTENKVPHTRTVLPSVWTDRPNWDSSTCPSSPPHTDRTVSPPCNLVECRRVHVFRGENVISR